MPKQQLEKPEFVRISLTIPAELKDDLQKHAANENWSAWVAECFRSQLLGIKAKQRLGNNMKPVIERLRSTAALEEVADYDRGKSAGRKWSENEATAGQLLRLANFCAESFGPRRSAGTRRGWPGRLFEVMQGVNVSEKEIMRFWESRVDKADVGKLFETHVADGPTDLLRGFAEGAVELWNSVKDEL